VPLTIQPATEDDFDEVAALFATSWRATYRGIVDQEYLDSLSADQWRGRLHKLPDNPLSHLLVAKQDGVIIGASWFGRSTTEGYPDDGEITALYLLPGFIGKGYGHSLIARTEEALLELGYRYIVLDAFVGNDRAIRFYHQHGFKVVQEATTVEIANRDYPVLIMRKQASKETDDTKKLTQPLGPMKLS
jgi:ribosomal protein S18 acetylase RimI-like enzyme